VRTLSLGLAAAAAVWQNACISGTCTQHLHPKGAPVTIVIMMPGEHSAWAPPTAGQARAAHGRQDRVPGLLQYRGGGRLPALCGNQLSRFRRQAPAPQSSPHLAAQHALCARDSLLQLALQLPAASKTSIPSSWRCSLPVRNINSLQLALQFACCLRNINFLQLALQLPACCLHGSSLIRRASKKKHFIRRHSTCIGRGSASSAKHASRSRRGNTCRCSSKTRVQVLCQWLGQARQPTPAGCHAPPRMAGV